jgi:hypothetical protein
MSDEPVPQFAKDGFQIDPVLQRRTRRVAVGYALLAAYYLIVMPAVLRYVRWQDLQQLAQDLTARSVILLTITAYVGANLVLSVCAWHVIAMHRLTSWVVAGAAAVFTTWACGSLILSLWKTLAASKGLPDMSQSALALVLLISYSACFVQLWRSISAFNGQRTRALEAAEGRIRT